MGEILQAKMNNQAKSGTAPMVYATCVVMGYPELRIGMTVDLQNVGSRFSSAQGFYWYITRIEHIYDNRRLTTTFECEAMQVGNMGVMKQFAEETGVELRESSHQSTTQAKTEDEMPVTTFEGIWDDTEGECPSFSEKGSASFYHVVLGGLADLGERTGDASGIAGDAQLILGGELI